MVQNQSTSVNGLPVDLEINRGQTQKDVNKTVLETLLQIFPKDSAITTLDLPCGDMEYLSYMHSVFPNAKLHGADIEEKVVPNYVNFAQMDFTKNFAFPDTEIFDLITSISGIMVFGNTLGFLRNCISRLKKGGTLIITNDNPATATDRLAYLFLARYRIFKPVFEDDDTLTQIVPIQELCMVLRMHNIEIEKIEYTSFYLKDLIYLPVALLIYPFQLLYLLKLKSATPKSFKKAMYPFKSLFCKHYIVTGKKV